MERGLFTANALNEEVKEEEAEEEEEEEEESLFRG